MVTETPTRNSGFVGGKFLSRTRAKKSPREKYEAVDLWVGAVLTLFDHVFILTDADEVNLI